MHVLRYIKGTLSLGVFFSSTNTLKLEAYCGADWGSCTNTQKSLTGYCVFHGSALMSWKTKKQPSVSNSSAGAKFRAMAATVCELQWIAYIMCDLEIVFLDPIPLYCDSKAAIHITTNPVFHEQMKHLDIDYHNVRN